MRPRRKDLPVEPAPEQGAATVTTTVQPRSQQFIKKVADELRAADAAAQQAAADGQAAFAEAYHHEQADTDLDRKQKELRAEWDRLQKVRDELQNKAKAARARGEAANAARDAHADEVVDAKRTLQMFGYDPDLLIQIPAVNAQIPPTTPVPVVNGADPTADMQLAEGVDRFIAAHETDPAGEAGTE